jgi:hypothetical protein
MAKVINNVNAMIFFVGGGLEHESLYERPDGVALMATTILS